MPSQVTGWMLAAHAGAGMPGQARASRRRAANSGKLHNACAMTCLAEDDPAGALGAVLQVLDGTAPVIGCFAVVEAHLLAQHPPGTRSG